MPGESKTSPRRLKAHERQRQALELRAAGRTFDEIAETLGYRGKAGAYHAVEAALRKTLQPAADEVRKINLERLNRMLVAIWPKVLEGNYAAIDRALKILEREAKLLGLDTQEEQPPQKIIFEVEYVNDRRQANTSEAAGEAQRAVEGGAISGEVQVVERGTPVEKDNASGEHSG